MKPRAQPTLHIRRLLRRPIWIGGMLGARAADGKWTFGRGAVMHTRWWRRGGGVCRPGSGQHSQQGHMGQTTASGAPPDIKRDPTASPGRAMGPPLGATWVMRDGHIYTNDGLPLEQQHLVALHQQLWSAIGGSTGGRKWQRVALPAPSTVSTSRLWPRRLMARCGRGHREPSWVVSCFLARNGCSRPTSLPARIRDILVWRAAMSGSRRHRCSGLSPDGGGKL